jgi:hypothetical protein
MYEYNMCVFHIHVLHVTKVEILQTYNNIL